MRITQVTKIKPNTSLALPLYSARVSAGFPSPAEEHMERTLDLHEYMVRHPAATFFVRAEGYSMIGAGIYSGDLLIVDRSLEPKEEDIVIAAVDGELTVKRLKRVKGVYHLFAENNAYQPIPISESLDVVIWGVVRHSVRSY